MRVDHFSVKFHHFFHFFLAFPKEFDLAFLTCPIFPYLSPTVWKFNSVLSLCEVVSLLLLV